MRPFHQPFTSCSEQGLFNKRAALLACFLVHRFAALRHQRLSHGCKDLRHDEPVLVAVVLGHSRLEQFPLQSQYLYGEG